MKAFSFELPRVSMKGLIGHWTAGGPIANATDLDAYHLLCQQDLEVVKGKPSIAANSGKLSHGYAAHTLNCNTDHIGMSLCGMAGAVESPWNPGRAPITEPQFLLSAITAATLCRFYSIPVTDETTLFHSEVQSNLGIRQRNKWDITRLPWRDDIVGARAVGNHWRDLIAKALKGTLPMPNAEQKPKTENPTAGVKPIPEGGQGKVQAGLSSGLNVRSGPGTSHPKVGSVPSGTMLRVLQHSGDWIYIQTPGGYYGWVSGQYVDWVDGPPVEAPTMPSEIRRLTGEIQDRLDAINKLL